MISTSIPRRARSCSQCKQSFSSGSSYFSMLSSDPEQGFLREDCCSACWSERVKNLDTTITSHWKGVIPEAVESTHQGQGFAALSNVERISELRTSLEGVDKTTKQRAFLLALYLERCKQLSLKKVLQGKLGPVRFYQDPLTEESFAVEVPLPPTEEELSHIFLASKLDNAPKNSSENTNPDSNGS